MGSNGTASALATSFGFSPKVLKVALAMELSHGNKGPPLFLSLPFVSYCTRITEIRWRANLTSNFEGRDPKTEILTQKKTPRVL